MIPIHALVGHISKNIGLFLSPAWLSYAVYRHLKKSFLVWFGNSLMENLMAPFGFPLKGLFGSIFGGKMSGGKTPDVAAQKRRFGVKNGSTMPLVGRPLLCKKWPLIINNRYKNENRPKMAPGAVKVKKINKKALQTALLSHFLSLDAFSPT